LSEQYDTALITLLLAKDRYENHGMKYYSMGANGNIGLIYAYKGNRAEAMKYYNAAFDYFDEHPDAEGLRHLNAAYAKGLAAMGDFKLAFEYYERYLHLHDSISRANTKQNVEEIEARYQNQKKEKENALLRSEKAELELSLQKEAFAKRIYLLVIGLFVIASIFAIVLIISIKRSDRKLRQQYATIREKNLKIQLLLREIHHHVKNNLNTIRSMLSMQAQKMDDGQTREVIQNIQGRIDSIVLVHKLLYVQDYSDNLELKRYLSELCKSIFQLYDVDDDKISLKLDLDDKLINKNECVNYGLMVNELVSNALKYAFPKNRPGEISVSYTENPGNIIISVSDNGVGYNVDEEKDEEKGFGLKMTEMIAKSYNGVLKVISTNEGTICKIIIPDKPIS
jgi:two-component sensor histidine kinase